MTRSMHWLCGSLVLTAASAAASPADTAPADIRFHRLGGEEPSKVRALVSSDEVYLPVGFLETALDLTQKKLSAERIGLCRDDLCVPFSADQLRFEQETVYVPARALIEALQGTLVWDPETLDLIVEPTRSEARVPAAGAPLDFTLEDLEGNEVSLSDFRGKKVVVFAWASW